MSVYDPDSARGDAEDKAIAYAREKHRGVILIHPDTFRVTFRPAEK